MKSLIGIYTCLILAFAAQQEAPPKPSIQPTAETLMKAQAANEKAQAKRDEAATEELKKLVEREIAKSAALPMTTSVQESVTQTSTKPSRSSVAELMANLVVIDGAVYMRIGDSIAPMPGGGASGCFSAAGENDVKVQNAKAKFAEMLKAESVKKEK